VQCGEGVLIPIEPMLAAALAGFLREHLGVPYLDSFGGGCFICSITVFHNLHVVTDNLQT
jgi:hypothetical protein